MASLNICGSQTELCSMLSVMRLAHWAQSYVVELTYVQALTCLSSSPQICESMPRPLLCMLSLALVAGNACAVHFRCAVISARQSANYANNACAHLPM